MVSHHPVNSVTIDTVMNGDIYALICNYCLSLKHMLQTQ